ncbi:MAG TPA: glycerophosphodiester phosphodiesterase [Gemmatimonadaceae bacterium]
MERIGHRGAKREYPENTIAAFKGAFARRADAIELDVHATRDGVIVVNHDPNLGKSFDGLNGAPIAGLDWATIAKASTSSKTRVPTLEEVFAIVPSGGTVYVEIKGRDIEQSVAETLSALPGVRCAVHSFDHDAIRRMRELAPTVPRGILFDRYPENVTAAMRDTGARDVWPEWRLIDVKLVRDVHEAGGRVIAWTVNDRDAAGELTRMGVDGLCTDDVRLLDGL